MILRKSDAQMANQNGLLSGRTNHLEAIRLIKTGLSSREVAKKLNMSIIDVLELSERVA